jgi:hypothetical protein
VCAQWATRVMVLVTNHGRGHDYGACYQWDGLDYGTRAQVPNQSILRLRMVLVTNGVT